MTIADPLDAAVRRAGGVLVGSGTAMVAAHYGSPVGELSVCIRAVGLADRSDLAVFVTTGPHGEIAELANCTAGGSLAIGGAAHRTGVWWCAAASDRLLAVCEPGQADELRATIEAVSRELPGLRTAEDPWGALALVGRNALRVLASATGLDGLADPRSVRPFSSAAIDNVDVSVLLQSFLRALVLVRAESAGLVWHALSEAGAQFGLSCVGAEAVKRFALLDQRYAAPPARLRH